MRVAATPPNAGEPHKNISSLAGSLGVSTPTISAWRNRYPDTPDTLHQDKWEAFMKLRNLGHFKQRAATKDREELTNEKLSSEIRLNEIKIAKEERKLIPADEVESFLVYAASKTKSALYQMVAETSPKCAGLDAGEIRGILRTAADVICRSMQTTVEDWQAEQEEARKAADTAAHKESGE